MIAAAMLLTLAACKDNNKDDCTDHTDEDGNLLCDRCGAELEDNSYEPDTLDCTLTVKTPEGKAIPGAKFTITLGGYSETLTADSDGKVTKSLVLGKYSVSFDYESLPSGFLPETSSITVDSENNITLTVIDNNPDGSQAKPFIISTDSTAIELGASNTLYYNYHGAANRKLKIEGEGLEVTYNGTVYTPVVGIIEIQLSSTIGEAVFFSVKNVGDTAFSGAIELIAPLGSLENPIPLTENALTVAVPEEGTVNYKWIADRDGVLVITSSTENNNVAITKTLANEVPISTQTLGTCAIYMAVTAGEEITVSVASTEKEACEVTFELAVYGGDESDPVPVLKEEIDFALLGGESIVFSVEAGKTFKATDEEGATVTYGGNVYTANEGVIEVVLTDGGLFTVTNTQDSLNNIDFEIK